jgi:hypothetical protein
MKAGLIAALVVIGSALWIFTRPDSRVVHADEPAGRVPLMTPSPPPDPVLADTMLADYASDDSSGKKDLNLMVTFLDSVFLLVKQRDTADYATNEDLVLFLQGKNSHQSPFLNQKSRALNDKGQLVDRWGSPLIFHPVSQKLLEIRSAGPDQKAYTEDDFLWPSPP